MNILAQCCGIVLMGIILYFHSTQKKVHLYTEQAFMNIWGVTIVSLLLDILSMVLLSFRDALPGLLVEIGCKAYVASLVWVGMFYVNYLLTDIYEVRYNHYRAKIIIFGVFFTACVFLMPIYISTESASKTYTYGPSANLAYIVAALVLGLMGYMLIRYKNRTSPRLRRVMWAWISVWMLAAIIEFISIQFMSTPLLIVGYASAVGTVILYLRLENPEANLDRQTGFFNLNAFVLYTRQLMRQGEHFCLLCMSCQFGNGDNVPSDEEESVREDVVRFILKIQGLKVFRITENEIVFLFFEEEEEERIYSYISARFRKPWGKGKMHMVRPRWCRIRDTEKVGSAEDFSDLFQYMLKQNHSDKNSNDVLTIDESVVMELNRGKDVEQLLIRAMEQDWVEVFFQPIYSTVKQRFVSAEALVRIHDSAGKIIPPGVFIDVAEKTGLIVKLGEMVFEKVCRFIQRENPAQYGIEYIEVNLSLIQCGYENLAESFIEIMQKYAIPPSHINLEITETASLSEKRILLLNMQQLKEFGVSFSLDDFGTGHSNLNYIVDMPVDIVKFDRDMTQSYFNSDKAKYVMDAAMHMIQGMQLQIVSEGIETKEQYDTMEKLGISYIQGFYFSKPLPEQEFLEFIKRNR